MFHVDVTMEDVRIITEGEDSEGNMHVAIHHLPSSMTATIELTHDELALGLGLALSQSGDGPEPHNLSFGPTYGSLLAKLDALWTNEVRQAANLHEANQITFNPFRFIP